MESAAIRLASHELGRRIVIVSLSGLAKSALAARLRGRRERSAFIVYHAQLTASGRAAMLLGSRLLEDALKVFQ